jgi:hypothetical protein
MSCRLLNPPGPLAQGCNEVPRQTGRESHCPLNALQATHCTKAAGAVDFPHETDLVLALAPIVLVNAEHIEPHQHLIIISVEAFQHKV